MEGQFSDTHRPPARRNRSRVWLAFLGVLLLIVLSSLAGRQLYELIPRAAVWAIIALGGFAGVLAVAFVYQGPLPRWGILTGAIIGAAAFVLAVLAGALTPAEIMHVVFFGALGAVVAPVAPRLALPLLLAASAGDGFLQALLPWRVGSLPDVAFNVVSAFGSYALIRYHRRKTLVV